MSDFSEPAFGRGSRGWFVPLATLALLTTLTLLTLGIVAARHAVAAPPADFQSSLVLGDALNGPSGFEIAPESTACP